MRQAGEEAARSVRRQLQEVRGEITARRAGERHWGRREGEVGGRNNGLFVENALLGCAEINFYVRDGATRLPRMPRQQTKTERTFVFLEMLHLTRKAVFTASHPQLPRICANIVVLNDCRYAPGPSV